MKKNKILLLIYLLLIGLIFSHNADHLILNRITITPTEAEMVSIYNPTSGPINLSNYYLSDAEKPLTDKYYYNLPTDLNYSSGSVSDFFIKFPNIDIESGDTLFIGLHDDEQFLSYYNFAPDLSLFTDFLGYSDDDYPFNSSFGEIVNFV